MCRHGVGGSVARPGGAGGCPQARAWTPLPNPAQKVPDRVFLPEKFIVVVVIGGSIKRVILALVFAQGF